MSANVDTMAYAGRRPWWVGIESGIANELPDDANGADIIGPAGLDWETVAAPVFVNDREVPGFQAMTRSDTGDTLGIVGMTYQPFGNAEMLDFGDALVDDGGAHWNTAGGLKGMRTVWGLMELPEHIRVAGDPSVIKAYLLLTNQHDGRGSFGAFVTPQRVVCANTLRAARLKASAHVNIRHSGNLAAKVAEARRTLRLTFQYLDTWQALMGSLTHQPLTDKAVVAFTEELIPVRPDAERTARSDAARDQIAALFRSSPTLEGVAPTAYRLFNAVAEYADHFAPNMTTKVASAADNRAASNIDGRGQMLKDRALDLLVPASAMRALVASAD